LKIEYLKLTNFANLDTSLKAKTIEIDFKKSKNKIILFTGPNGSGKTSILSCLHPFATNGNLDVRNDNSLILIGKDGYKEIHINDDGNEYIIKHYYTANKETHSVKSYIERNGMELNPNGNVTSFKELVKEELDIEMDYLKLTRLGSNVTNFIDLKTTDRKAFMGKILDEVEIYLKYYKKLTNDMREVKSVISHLVDKISKLSIIDIEDLEKSQKKLKKEIDASKSELDKATNDFNIILYEIEKYDSPLVIKESLDSKKKDMEKLYKQLKKLDTENLTLEDCTNLIHDLEKQLIELNSKLSSSLEKREDLINSLDKLLQEKIEVKKELQKIESSSEIQETESMIQELRKAIERRSKECNLIDYNPSFTKKDLEDLIVVLDKSMEVLYTTYEFGINPIKKALEYISSGTDISEYITSNKKKSEKNKLQNAAELIYQSLLKSGFIKTNCGDSTCKILRFYNEFFDLVTEEPDTIIEDNEFITFTKMAYQNMMSVIQNIQSEKSLLEKLPKEIQSMFTLKEIIEKIKSFGCIYDKEILYSELTKITDYELQKEDLNTLASLKEKLKLLKKSIGNSDYFEERDATLTNEIESYQEDISSIQDSILELKEKISQLTSEIVDMKDLKLSIEKRDEIESEYNTLQSSYQTVRELFEKKKELSDIVDQYTYHYNKQLKEYNDNEYRLQSYQSLNEELNTYNMRYDEMELVKSALSSKEGIPLLYIQVYLKNIQEITNELLEIIYEDELYIDNFNITADEFKIPYVKNGKSIKDVCYASQGERSFISLALSFALIYQSISRYNIMLLDEIDATLDTSNREKFLQILEKQLGMIEGEQIFLISHNNMFNMYPVDIIDMHNKQNSDNKLANYIQIKIL
jgi:DNA repair exonuclease SbcCD ATPase subunit